MRTLALIPLLVLAGAPREAFKPGVVGRYWHLDHELSTFPGEVLDQEPQHVRIDGMISFDSAEHRRFRDVPFDGYVAVEWKGLLRVPEGGDYTFFLRSLDGSLLYLDERLVIDHDGTHSVKETASDTITMKAGDHSLRVLYFQNGMTRCVLSWQRGDSGRQVIPSVALWHRYDKSVDRGSP